MDDMDDSEHVRLRIILPRITPTPGQRFATGAPAMVGKVVTASASIQPGLFLLVNPVTVFGPQVEGGPATTTIDTSTVPVLLLGPGKPAMGDMLICRYVEHRWIAERKTTTPTSTNGCNCTWPKTLSFRGSVTQATAAFYFNNAPASFPEPTYTLTYGPRPGDIPLNLQLLWFNYPPGVADPWYITMPANAWFSPPIAGFSAGAPINIYFYMWVKNCSSNIMVIDAPYGLVAAPGGTRGAGNNVINYVQLSCNPFTMSGSRLGSPVITGTHGADDIIPDVTGNAGFYSNPRVGL